MCAGGEKPFNGSQEPKEMKHFGTNIIMASVNAPGQEPHCHPADATALSRLDWFHPLNGSLGFPTWHEARGCHARDWAALKSGAVTSRSPTGQTGRHVTPLAADISTRLAPASDGRLFSRLLFLSLIYFILFYFFFIFLSFIFFQCLYFFLFGFFFGGCLLVFRASLVRCV